MKRITAVSGAGISSRGDTRQLRGVDEDRRGPDDHDLSRVLNSGNSHRADDGAYDLGRSAGGRWP
jgi:hypothetical protein